MKKILIVDDKKENLYFLESLLKGFGYDITAAVNGKDALKKLRSDSFNMIISDILMPEMDGFQLLRIVKGDNNLKNIPFIFYTATYTDAKDKEFGLNLGACEYIEKPIDPEELIKTIQVILKDCESGKLKPKKLLIEKEEEVFRLYSERLVQKLENKMLNLEREVAKRKQVEKVLHIEKDNLINVFEAMEDGVYIVNQQYDIQYVNSVLIKDFGTYEGRKCYKYFHDRKEICPWCKNHEVFAGKTVRWEWYSSKNQKTYDLIDSPLQNSDGSISKLEIFRDITERNIAEKTISKHLKNILALHQSSLSISKLLNIQDIGHGIVETLEKILDWKRGSIWIISESGKELELLAHTSMGLEQKSLTEELDRVQRLVKLPGDGISGWVAFHGKAVRTGNVKKDPRYIVADPQIQSELCVPLSIVGRTIGSINVESIKSNAFDENDERLLLILASQAAIAIENARLFEKVQQELAERKKSEETLLKLSTAVTQSPSVIAITDLKGNLEYVNPKFTELTGYTSKEVIGKNPRILKSGKQADEFYKELWNTISSGKEWRGEFHNKKKNGELFWQAASISPIIDKQGKIINYIKIAEDITERKRAEQVQKVLYNISNAATTTDNLKKLIILIQKELGTIIDTNNFYIALYDPKTNRLSLPFIADEKDKFTSFPAGKTLTYYIIKSQKSLLVNKKKLKELEQIGIIKSFGSDAEIWLGVPLKVEGEIKGVLVVQSYTDKNAYDESDMEMLEFVSDQISISIDRKKAQDDLISALEKATESDRLKSAFLATMSHELRTPLNAIIGFSDILKSGVNTDEVEGFSTIINNSGYHLLDIVNDVFDITLLESGQSKINKEKHLLHTIINNVRDIIISEKSKLNKSIDIFFKAVDEDKDRIVFTDKAKLQQVLINVLKNALKFTHKGSTFYFRLPCLDPSVVNVESKASKEISKILTHKDKTILIAEDNESNFELLKILLRKSEATIIWAKNGKEAVDYCIANKDVHLILMDIKMPVLNGLIATSMIKKKFPDLPIVAQTAHAIAGDKKRALEAGCDAYIAKPIKKNELYNLIEEYLKE